MKQGFTLIELLVVVLIIGILAAIALPMYQKAVLRSRFAVLMPIAKAMADSNEAYYLEHGNYAPDPQELPVQGQLEYPTGTTLEFGQNLDYAYVLASNPDARNNYIVYQKHSANYPGEIHCEALTGDELAESICSSLGNGTAIGTTLTDGYTTYIIEGIGAGLPVDAGGNENDCSAATAMGLTCNISENEQGQTVKLICTMIGDKNVCRTKTNNEDGSYTSVTCVANADNVCTGNWESVLYDANGNKVSQRYCSSVDSSGNCSTYNPAYGMSYNAIYDANGNLLAQVACSAFDSSGNCTSYSSRTEYTYDENGNKLTQRYCGSGQIDNNGNCTSYYAYGSNFDYTYDENGNMLTQRSCKTMDSNGKCATYQTSDNYNYTYDENGNKLAVRQCTGVNSSGDCTAYGNSSSYDYTYDANGNMLTQRYCQTIDSSGTCTTYSSSNAYDYTYDANGNQLTRRTCGWMDDNGECLEYNSTYAYDWTYDANGNKVSERTCSTVDYESGECTWYSGGYDYSYDDNGKQIATRQCTRVDSSTGECTTYGNISTSPN